MRDSINKLEAQLDSFDASVREKALVQLKAMADAGDIGFVSSCGYTNMHFHTFYSFNSNGFSPSKVAWLAKKSGLEVAGIIDFDVFDGLNEFYEAAAMLNLKGCCGMETRVFVPEFVDKVINSPGEPGIAYHIAAGIPEIDATPQLDDFKNRLCDNVKNRNLTIIERVNNYLTPIELDYEIDVLPLTPAGNVTERHITLAYARKAKQLFGDIECLRKFWHEKLNTENDGLEFPEGFSLLNLIRAKTMKHGAVGYIQPDARNFAAMANMNKFTLAAGGIPTLAWLDGTSEGERETENLLEVAMSTGVEAVNIIPERNYTSGLGKDDDKCKKLYEFIETCEKSDLPIIAGTEMNSPGQRFVDDFEANELKPLVPIFLKGALIIYAHSVLQRRCGFGYTSDWAKENFSSRADKNVFFETLGRNLSPVKEDLLSEFSKKSSVDDILSQLK